MKEAAPASSSSSGGKGKRRKKGKKKGKKKKSRRRVKAMLSKARWDWRGTSLNPTFKAPTISKRLKDHSSNSSGSSSSNAESAHEADMGLFDEPARVRKIAKRCPGLLSRQSMVEARRSLVMGVGETSSLNTVLPVFLKYYRQVLSHQLTSRPMNREALTLASIADALVEGEVLHALDIAVQRTKSLELMSRGTPAETATRLEVVLPERSSAVSMEESREILAEARREQNARPWGERSWNLGGRAKPRVQERKAFRKAT